MVEQWGREKLGILSEGIDKCEVLLIPLEAARRSFVRSADVAGD